MTEQLARTAPSAQIAPLTTDSVAQRIRRLQTEARGLARQQVQALEQALAQVERMSADIADGGEAYPPGVREIARRLAEDCAVRAQAIEAIAARA